MIGDQGKVVATDGAVEKAEELGVNLAGVEEIIRLRRELDRLQGGMERRIGTLQSEISERLQDYRAQHQLAAPGEDDARDNTGDGADEEA